MSPTVLWSYLLSDPFYIHSLLCITTGMTQQAAFPRLLRQPVGGTGEGLGGGDKEEAGVFLLSRLPGMSL